jgi:hypothetical protein
MTRRKARRETALIGPLPGMRFAAIIGMREHPITVRPSGCQ